MMCCELRKAHGSKTLERSMSMPGETLGCKPAKRRQIAHVTVLRLPTKRSTPYYNVITTFMFGNRVIVTHETSSTMRGAIHGMQSTMEQLPSCWIVAANDMSRPLRRATYGMQNAMELRHSCLVVVTHETSSTFCGFTYWMQRNRTTAFMFDRRNT